MNKTDNHSYIFDRWCGFLTREIGTNLTTPKGLKNTPFDAPSKATKAAKTSAKGATLAKAAKAATKGKKATKKTTKKGQKK